MATGVTNNILLNNNNNNNNNMCWNIFINVHLLVYRVNIKYPKERPSEVWLIPPGTPSIKPIQKYCLSIGQQRGATQLEQYRYHYIQDSHILQTPDEDTDLIPEDESEHGPQQFL